MQRNKTLVDDTQPDGIDLLVPDRLVALAKFDHFLGEDVGA